MTGEVPDREPDCVIRSEGNGVILEIDVPRLLEAIRRLDVVVVMIPAVGDFIPTGGRLFEVYGAAELDADRLLATVEIDELHDLLLGLGSRPFLSEWHVDEEGTPRLRVTMPTWDVYVALAFEEIRYHGAGILQVMRRLRSAVDDLLRDLPEDRHPALKRQIRMLEDTAEWAFRSDLERAAALHPDAQGIGSGGGFAPIDESEHTDDNEPDRGDHVDPSSAG